MECKECKISIIGRSDKQFCTNYCRSAFHNRQYASDRKYVRHVNIILNRNRQILFDCLQLKTTVFPHLTLLEQGFNFSFFTSEIHLKKGQICRFCYDIGYYNYRNNKLKIKLKKTIC